MSQSKYQAGVRVIFGARNPIPVLFLNTVLLYCMVLYNRVFDKNLALGQTGPTQTSTAPLVRSILLGQFYSELVRKLNQCREKWSRNHGSLSHFVFTVAQMEHHIALSSTPQCNLNRSVFQ